MILLAWLTLNLLNAAASLAVFFYSSNRLSAKQWTFRQPELWAHTLLVGGSLAVFLTSIWDVGSLKYTAEVMMNVAIAFYLGVRAWRKKRQNPPKFPFPKYYTKLIKGKKYE